MDEFIQEFLIEGSELLDQLDRDFVELEKNPGSKELIARIFRAIHTLKGTSGTIGLKKLEAVNHSGENILSRIRDGKMSMTVEITTALLAMIDVDRKLLASLESSGQEGELDIAPTVASLNAILAAYPVEPAPKVVLPPPMKAAPKQVSENLASAGNTDAAQEKPAEQAVTAAAAPSEEKTPAVAPVPVAKLGEMLVEQGAASQGDVDAALERQREGDGRRIGEILVQDGAAEEQEVAEVLNKQQDCSESALHSNIRVDVTLLDKVMNLVGELVLARNQILQFTSNQKDAAFLSTAQRLNLITTELQEGVMKTRMQPIGNVWNRFPRIVRDLAHTAGKQVKLEMHGSQTELDKTIIEAIKDPLTHIVRNALDHGLETPEGRKAAGKPEQGVLRLRAFHEGGQVNIEISDDGSGLDVEAIRAKAVERGVISPRQAQKMSEREIFGLIFLAGFSTAKKVTNISGRGVGMDVVKNNIEKIGGTVEVSSMRHQGTTLRIKIPLTLAIIPALIVTSGDERFAIPQVSLVELVRLENKAAEEGIERIQEACVYRLRGNLLPILYLNRSLKLPAPEREADAINIVVLQADGRQFGLVVDEINDTEEIVVKPLSKQLKGIACFAGATIMGDGKVALILDIHGLAQRAQLVGNSHEQAGEMKEQSSQAMGERESWLLFRVGEQGKLAVPLSMVSRLEEIDPKTVERSGARAVVQYRGEIMPLLCVAEALRDANGNGAAMEKMAGEVPMQVVVYSAEGHSVGLVVDEILDIVDQHVTVSRASEDARLLGSAVIQQHVTDLLNVPQLVGAMAASGRVA